MSNSIEMDIMKYYSINSLNPKQKRNLSTLHIEKNLDPKRLSLEIKLKDINRMKASLNKKLEELSVTALQLEEINQNGKSKKDKHKDSSIEREKQKEEQKKKEQDSIAFVETLNNEMKERKKREKNRLKRLLFKTERDEIEKEQRKRMEKEEAIKKEKESLMNLYKLQKEKREVEFKKIEEQSAKYPIPPQNEYLYKKLEERFQKEVVLPILETKKSELAKKRNQLKSVTKEEIEEHQKKHMEAIALKNEQRLSIMKKLKEQEMEIISKQKQWVTTVSTQIQQEVMAAKEQKEKMKKAKQSYREKMQQYAEMIKEIKPVIISEEKAEELRKQIEQLKHPVRKTREVRGEYSVSRISPSKSFTRTSGIHGNRSMDTGTNSRDSPSVKVSLNLDGHKQRKLSEEKTTTKQGNLQVSLKKAIQQDTEVRESKNKKFDYLTEMRKKKTETPGFYKSVMYNWESDMKDSKISEAEKINRIVKKANLIEERAKMKEKLLKVKGNITNNYEMAESVSDMLLEAIKAKLAVLEHI